MQSKPVVSISLILVPRENEQPLVKTDHLLVLMKHDERGVPVWPDGWTMQQMRKAAQQGVKLSIGIFVAAVVEEKVSLPPISMSVSEL